MLLQRRPIPALVLTLSLLAAASAQAESGLYLNVDKLAIKGDATAVGHKNWIELNSLQWGAGNSVSYASGFPQVGKASASEITWTQGLEPSASALGKDLLSGTVRSTAVYELVKPGKADGKPWLKLETTEQVTTGLSFSNNSVSASGNFTSIALTYEPPDKTGKPVTTTWNVAKNTVAGPSYRTPQVKVDGSGPSAAAQGFSIYLALGSGPSTIAGDSTAAGYENWIQLGSAQWGMGVGVSSAAGGSQREVSKPSLSELVYTLPADGTLPVVLQRLVSGTKLPQATLEFVQPGAKGPITVLQLAMTDVFFTGLSLSSGGGGEAYVSESLTFAKMSQTIWGVKDDGTRGEPFSFGYDVAKAKYVAGAIAKAAPGFGSGNLDGAVAAATPVPEPQTWAMMLAGIAGLLGVARRRRAAT